MIDEDSSKLYNIVLYAFKKKVTICVYNNSLIFYSTRFHVKYYSII